MSKLVTASSPGALKAKTSRRKFLYYSGASILTTGLLLSGCKDDDVDNPTRTLSKPASLNVEQNDAGDLVLTWTDSNTQKDGSRIERSTAVDSGFAQVAEVGSGVTTYTDVAANLEPGTTYYYRVYAYQGTEKSPFSDVVSSMGGTMLVDLGSGDLGVLNYAYALEQLEAAFYIEVMNGSYFSSAPDMEKRILEDLRHHEVAHRDFFEAAISSVGDPIPGLTVNFDSIDFSSRDSVLGTAKAFENLGVAAYNGAGKLLQNKEYLLIAGKIVSVEARHAAVINDLVNPGSTDFANMADANGLDKAMMPSDVLSAASAFVHTRITADNLPTT